MQMWSIRISITAPCKITIYSYFSRNILAPNSRTSLSLDRLSVLKSNDTKAAYAKIIIWVIVIGKERLVLCIGVDQLDYSQFYEGASI